MNAAAWTATVTGIGACAGGLPGYTFECASGELWRSRFDATRNVIVVNNGHRDFVFASHEPPSRSLFNNLTACVAILGNKSVNVGSCAQLQCRQFEMAGFDVCRLFVSR